MANVSLRNINKIYDNGVQAVFDFNLEIENKEFIVLVGPSGCGKSTTLRMIAGLEQITSGELLIDGEYVNDVPSKNRGIAMVFQSYALYPHMTVYDNMGFGLKIRKIPKEVIKEKVLAVSKMLGLDPYLYRKPKNLSGGQRQRVALGRAIIRDAKVYLFDEPLSNLDAKLRVQMRTEIAKLHKQIGATSIYVTHDQIEAMTMASRIVVMKDGYIQQVGTPEEIYNRPTNVFVGGFIGTPPMNFIVGRISEDGYFISKEETLKLKIPEDKYSILESRGMVNNQVIFGLRPEYIYYSKEYSEESKDFLANISVDVYEMLGHESNVYFEIEGQQIVAILESKNKIDETEIQVLFDMNEALFYDFESQLLID